VIRPPVSGGFRRLSEDERRALRSRLGVDGPLLVTVKRLHPLAAHEDLVRAMVAVAASHPGVRLFIVGSGELRPALEAQATQLGVSGHVRFLGAVPNDAVWQYCAAADVFVLPSRLEAWPTVTIEALACGTPIVAADNIGAREVHDTFPEDVVLCPVGDAAALAEAIGHAIGHPRRVDRRTTETLERDFTPAACVRAYLDVYRQANPRR
jgi:glycosyltransferase involved in cell wall biosynthesis